MTIRRWIALGLLLGGSGILHLLSAQGYSQVPSAETSTTLIQRLAKKWEMKETEVTKKLQELSVEVERELTNGRTVDLPGLGTLRVVRITPYREFRDGKGVTVTRNTVDLKPSGNLAAAANSPGAQPVETVLPNEPFLVKPVGTKRP